MKCKCGCLESVVRQEDSKVIERCKTCGREKTVRDDSKDTSYLKRKYSGYLNRGGFGEYAPDDWLSHSIGRIDK